MPSFGEAIDALNGARAVRNKIDRAFEFLDEEDGQRLLEALRDTSIGANTIAKALTQAGFSVSPSPVEKWRAREGVTES